jgi:murein DD-endopeptidase MepM/ murein hydrolase activator NlpD
MKARSRLIVNLAALGVLAIVTVGWVLTQVVGSGALTAPFVVTVDLASSGGVFTNQEVTYRGVLVGTVGDLTLNEDGGVDIELRIRPEWDGVIPADVSAKVQSKRPCEYRLSEGWERLPHVRTERAPKTNSKCRGRAANEDVAQSLVTALEQWAKEHPSAIADTTPPAPPRPLSVGADVDFIWPLIGEITSFFGDDNGREHTGLDINGATGDPFVAAAAGRVRLAEPYFGYGNTIILDHGNGLATLYGHLFEGHLEVGEAVEQGDVIGLVGCTGSCTGDHLHFEIRVDDEPVDPLPYLVPRPPDEPPVDPDQFLAVRRARN